VKKIKQSYPRRRKMLAVPFGALSDADFRQLVVDGLAIPSRQGNGLFVSKWRTGPGMDTEAFLTAVHDAGSHLEARRFGKDVNVRVVRAPVQGKTRR
jgi:hypothetical protein